jgi:hypothetical protein
MTKDEAFRFLEMYRNWNVGQKGFSDDENVVLDERRKTMIHSYKVIRGSEPQTAG